MPAEVFSKTILNKTKQSNEWFFDDYTINPYSGCSFNCLYCYIRGSKYGFNMAEKVSVKANAVELLEKQLRIKATKQQYGFIVMSSATDPYLHFEKEYQLTRQLLEVILKYKFPVHIITKSDLVIRDFDLLQQINEQAILPADLQSKLIHKVLITFSFSNLDDSIANIFEPGATAPNQRLQALKASLNHGFYSGVSLMPLLPYISDTSQHLEYMFSTFKDAGVKYIMPASLTLFGNNTSDSKTLVLRAVQQHYPLLHKKYLEFFGNSNQMPAYYATAFNKALALRCSKYEINNRIVF